MKTVHEISKITGISARTLHYYDEIGLLRPTAKSEAGYRLYDDRALETLQRILYFREFDLPLKEIKAVMENPALDETKILQMQRDMLLSKKERIERLISHIDSILKGENEMSFEVFNKTEIQDMYESMAANMREDQKAIFISRYGSMEAFRQHFMESASSEAAQKNFQKVVEWYGDKDSALAASRNPGNADLLPSCQRRLETVLGRLAGKRNCDVRSPEVTELLGEYDLVSRQLYQMENLSCMMLELVQLYRTNEEIQKVQDSIYGTGFTLFFAEAAEAFYQKGGQN